MSYYEVYSQYKNKYSNERIEDITSVVSGDNVNISQFAVLLSPQAEKYLEDIAVRAHELTTNNFGKTIQLYTPMYLSDYCENKCAYCGFATGNSFKRKKLTLEEVEKEACLNFNRGIAQDGLNGLYKRLSWNT
jgi:2-iminoacetate synthase